MTGTRGWAAAVLAFVLAAPVSADVGLTFASDQPDPSWEDVLYLGLGLALSDQGYSSVRGVTAEYQLLTDYEVGAEGVTVTLTLSGGASDAALARVEVALTLEGDLDVQIVAAVRRLLGAAALDHPAPSASAPVMEGVLVLPPTKVIDPFTLGQGFVVHALGGGAAYFGRWASVARYGVLGGLQAGWFFPWQGLRLVGALRAVETRDFTNDGLEGGPLYLTTAGADAEVGLGVVPGFRVFADASAGVAVLSVADPWRNKSVPYADAGLRAEFLLAGVLLGADVRFQAVFDPEVVLLSLLPAVTVGKEF
jgi:hypothetical protein